VRRVLFLLLILLGSARAADAQVLGYAIAGPAGFSGFFGSNGSGGQAAAGAEVLIRSRAGVGGEFGIMVNSSSAMWVTSVNGVLHILPGTRGHGTSPFITGGYTRLSSGEGTFSAWNAGAGVHVWPKARVGVRAEFRDHVRSDARGNVHYWMLRAGVVIR
jgi:hypothetical protein